MVKHGNEPTNQYSIEPLLLNRAAAANFLSISPRLVDDLEHRGVLRAVRIPGVRRKAYDVDELRKVVDGWKREGVE